uniref:Uncharacterized protein n=1 Tax=Timema shepardi TaxID=629360 RepID=A0A7R9AL85_TIMSH|nr:unnamed protein product [Timema shepardi]
MTNKEELSRLLEGAQNIPSLHCNFSVSQLGLSGSPVWRPAARLSLTRKAVALRDLVFVTYEEVALNTIVTKQEGLNVTVILYVIRLQHALIGAVKGLLWLTLLSSVLSVTSAGPNTKNHELLTRLGMTRRRMAPNHHRKRVASESRGSHHSADSHMFVIKLPPNPYYYSLHKPLKTAPTNANSINNIPMNFRSNGKPAKVYHWNLPVLKKMAAKYRDGDSTSRLSTANKAVNSIQMSSSWSHSMANEVHDERGPLKPISNRKSSQKLNPSVSYYAPASPKKSMFQKNFSANGKPQSFYVIEKSKKPIYYQRLLP